ncbi:hypothetical protein [Cellulomonas sp. HZM]|uniref:hypothetical protein n=1 Tax=Cellulomonas sp. HZM TaxID=1454010 RepID=UPI000A409598|nr:hypothetical protein [Cellulomonas sp. HZM]
MIIDCDSCTARPVACADCVVTFLTVTAPRAAQPAGTSPAVDLDHAERHAIGVLAGCGLVPPLRLDPVAEVPGTGSSGAPGAAVEHQSWRVSS